MAADERGADAAIVFDAGMLDADTPALTVGTRGMVWADLVVTTGERPAHSGEFGGAALNAVHVLHRLLAAVLPDPETGRPPEPLRAGLEPPSQAELDAWAQLPPGDRLLAEAGARPADARAGEELHVRTMAGTSVDVHRLCGGRAAHDRARARRGEPVGPARGRPAQRGDRPRAGGAAARRAARRRRARAAPARRRAVALRPDGAGARGRRRARSSARPASRPWSSARAARSRSWPPSPSAGSRRSSAASRCPRTASTPRRELPDRVAGARPEGRPGAVRGACLARLTRARIRSGEHGDVLRAFRPRRRGRRVRRPRQGARLGPHAARARRALAAAAAHAPRRSASSRATACASSGARTSSRSTTTPTCRCWAPSTRPRSARRCATSGRRSGTRSSRCSHGVTERRAGDLAGGPAAPARAPRLPRGGLLHLLLQPDPRRGGRGRRRLHRRARDDGARARDAPAGGARRGSARRWRPPAPRPRSRRAAIDGALARARGRRRSRRCT